jgi:hypothetical protein
MGWRMTPVVGNHLSAAGTPGTPRASPRLELEHPPTDVVPSTLVCDDLLTDRIRELLALPSTFEAAGTTLIPWSASTSRLDGVGSGSEVVLSHMSDACGLARGIGGVSSRSRHLSCRSHGLTARRPGRHRRHASLSPGADRSNRFARSRVRRALGLEEVLDVFGACRCPQRVEVMVGVSERATSADRDEARVALLREDHGRRVEVSTGGPTAAPEHQLTGAPRHAHAPAKRDGSTARVAHRRPQPCPRSGAPERASRCPRCVAQVPNDVAQPAVGDALRPDDLSASAVCSAHPELRALCARSSASADARRTMARGG